MCLVSNRNYLSIIGFYGIENHFPVIVGSFPLYDSMC